MPKGSAQKRQSPYQRYGKKPFRYSDHFKRWEEAARSGNVTLSRELAEKHAAHCASLHSGRRPPDTAAQAESLRKARLTRAALQGRTAPHARPPRRQPRRSAA